MLLISSLRGNEEAAVEKTTEEDGTTHCLECSTPSNCCGLAWCSGVRWGQASLYSPYIDRKHPVLLLLPTN